MKKKVAKKKYVKPTVKKNDPLVSITFVSGTGGSAGSAIGGAAGGSLGSAIG
jgi:hypothetical protein